MKKKTKNALKTVGAVGAVASLTYLTIGNIFYCFTLTKKGLNSSINEKLSSPNKKEDEYTVYLNGYLTAERNGLTRQTRKKL